MCFDYIKNCKNISYYEFYKMFCLHENAVENETNILIVCSLDRYI